MATSPNYANTPAYGVGNLTTGITTLTVSGVTGLTSILAAGASGTRFARIRAKATGTTAAGIISIWLYSGSGNAQLIDQLATIAVTPSGTLLSSQIEKAYTDFVVPTGYTLYASTYNTENWNVEAFGGNL